MAVAEISPTASQLTKIGKMQSARYRLCRKELDIITVSLMFVDRYLHYTFTHAHTQAHTRKHICISRIGENKAQEPGPVIERGGDRVS